MIRTLTRPEEGRRTCWRHSRASRTNRPAFGGAQYGNQRLVIPGIVKNGIVVPQNDTPLPDGAHVDIVIGPADVTPALQAEVDQWEKASDEAWAMIDRWEAEDR